MGVHMHIFTVGHSTWPVDEFIDIVRAHDVQGVVDIRTVPKSRHNPQFGQDQLAESLNTVALGYEYLKSLGGLRHPRKDSINVGWRNDSFRGYADYMQTEEFAAGLDELISLAGQSTVAIMCAEAVPWRCHRSLVGDALLVRGIEVFDIFNSKTAKPHTLTSFAKIEGERITYPKENV